VKRFLLLFASAVLAAANLWSEVPSLLSLEAAVSQAVAVNVDYQNALLSVERARNSLSTVVNWKGIAVSVTQKQTSATVPGATTTTTNLGFNLPLLDQLGASVSIDPKGSSQVAVTVNPLSHSDTALQARITFEKAVLSAAQVRKALETSVRKAFLAQLAAQAQLEVQKKVASLKETAYQEAKVRYEKAQVTLAEVRTALQEWTLARSTQTALERNLIKAKTDLASQLQAETVDLEPLDSASLKALVEALGPIDSVLTGSSTSVKVQNLEVAAQQARAESVWLFDPGLSVSGSASFPSQGESSWNASMTLTLALGDWQRNERALADRSVELAQKTLEAQRTSSRSAEAQALLSVEAALAAVENRVLALEQARELFVETQLLSKNGKATVLELEDAQLGVASAENNLFTAWSELYGARLDQEAVHS